MKRTIVRLSGAAILAVAAIALQSASPVVRVAVAVIVGLPSAALMIISRRQLGSSFAVLPKAKALVTTGPYARLQHPMYMFLDLFLLSVIVAINVPVILCAWGVLVVIQALRARREEQLLSEAFGATYEEYRSHTWI